MVGKKLELRYLAVMHSSPPDRLGKRQPHGVAPAWPLDPFPVVPVPDRSPQVAEHRSNRRFAPRILVARSERGMNRLDPTELRRSSAMSAEVIAGVELTPDATMSPPPRRRGIQPADPRDKLARIRQVEIVRPHFDTGLGDEIIGPLERPCRVDDQKRAVDRIANRMCRAVFAFAKLRPDAVREVTADPRTSPDNANAAIPIERQAWATRPPKIP